MAYSPGTFKPLLERLVKEPDIFTSEDLELSLNHIFTPDAVYPSQIGSFLTALHVQRIERRPEALSVAADVLRKRAVKAIVQDSDRDFIVDIVGTGGDGHDTFNVSTTAAVVAAGAGARVVKHGSRASTSASGSADLLESLGCIFVPPSGASQSIPLIPFTFVLAPHYHPALALIAPHRKALPFRTLFNILGPLINPARPQGMVLGVADPSLGPIFAKALKDGGVQRALVVCGAEGLDEISCAGDTWAWELKDGRVTSFKLHPEMFGLSVHPLKAVSGGTPTENAETFKTLLTSGNQVQERLGPILDFVLMNAAALLVVAGSARDYKEGVQLARESVTSGKAWKALAAFRDSSVEASSQLKQA